MTTPTGDDDVSGTADAWGAASAFERVTPGEAVVRESLAGRVAEELRRAGLAVLGRAGHGDPDGGAVIEVDLGADDAGGVYVTWEPAAELAQAAADAVDRGDLDAPDIVRAGAVAIAGRDTVVGLLRSLGFVAECTADVDTRPLAVRVSHVRPTTGTTPGPGMRRRTPAVGSDEGP